MNRRCGYNNNKEQHHQLQQSSMFLPIMLCSRSSLKDVALTHSHRRNSKVSAVATPGNHHQSLRSDHVRRSKSLRIPNLRRLFSAKSLAEKPTSTTTTTDGGIRSMRGGRDRRKTSADLDWMPPEKSVDVADLDPPLPVLRRGLEIGEERDSLWKRRSRGGSALGSLQLHGGATALLHPTPSNTV